MKASEGQTYDSIQPPLGSHAKRMRLASNGLEEARDDTMPVSSMELQEAVADVILAAFAALPKTGKPQPNEYTVLAGFAICSEWQESPVVISLGTGTKCLGGSQRSLRGDTINDSHAEVVARRALLRWLYAELRSALEDHERSAALPDKKPLLFHFCPKTGLFRPSSGWTLHFFVTQPPCGDASLFAADSPDAGTRTGAKPLAVGGKLPQAGDVDRECLGLGALRRKPGKGAASGLAGILKLCHKSVLDTRILDETIFDLTGDATLSLSCSDKMARWVLLGVQGALLSSLLSEPLRICSITVGIAATSSAACQQDCLMALERAVHGRTLTLLDRLPGASHTVCCHVIRLAEEKQGLQPSARRGVPSGVSVNWSSCPSRSWQLHPGQAVGILTMGIKAEVTLAASGRKAGAAKKGPGWNSQKTRSSICKAAFWESFSELKHRLSLAEAVSANPGSDEEMDQRNTQVSETKNASLESEQPGSREQSQPSYGSTKAGTAYHLQWRLCRKAPSVFEAWIEKPPELEGFH